MSVSGWIGVDLDGTVAHYAGWKGPDHIGEPIAAMVARIQSWLYDGIEVRIVTARVAATEKFVGESQMSDNGAFAEQQRKLIGDWCEKHIGTRLAVTAQKDFAMIELWDDRAIQVKMNTGEPIHKPQ